MKNKYLSLQLVGILALSACTPTSAAQEDVSNNNEVNTLTTTEAPIVQCTRENYSMKLPSLSNVVRPDNPTPKRTNITIYQGSKNIAYSNFLVCARKKNIPSSFNDIQVRLDEQETLIINAGACVVVAGNKIELSSNGRIGSIAEICYLDFAAVPAN